MKKIRFLLIFLIGLGVAAMVANHQINNEKISKNKSVIAKNFGSAFTLKNHLGIEVTEKKFQNQYRLIYFGFTYCPAICPTELQRIASILKDLGEKGEAIQPIFITIDPERDTVKTMKNYVELFHPRLIGLTGTPAQIDAIKKGYKIYAAKVQEENMNDYTMDHSSFIYFMGPNDSLLRIFKVDDTIEDMVHIIDSYLQ